MTFEPPAPRRHPLRTALAWLVIIVCVGFFAASAFERDTEQRKSSDLAEVHVQFLLQSRYVVGAYDLLRNFPSQSNTADTLATSVLSTAKTPPERLLLVPVIAELKGKQAAVRMLDEL